jgi:hypothetical protein
MAEQTKPKVRLEKLGVFGRTTCFLVHPDRKPFLSEGHLKRGEAVDALVAYWKEGQ